jgi:hypothetical protein
MERGEETFRNRERREREAEAELEARAEAAAACALAAQTAIRESSLASAELERVARIEEGRLSHERRVNQNLGIIC